jgi:ketosteroid isomerase-like protein
MRKILLMSLAIGGLVAWTVEPHRAEALPKVGAAQVRAEVRQALDRYREAMLSRDYETMISFWSDSPDFVFAGDGRILGGIEAWKAETTRHYKQTQSWVQWDWQSVHIVALSETAASATLEFRFRWVDVGGQTRNTRGAWTYVFLKSDGVWKVVHTNGTHVEL